MILDQLLSKCDDDKLQSEALSKDWDLKTFMKYATMKQDIKAQTEDMECQRCGCGKLHKTLSSYWQAM